MASGYGSFPGNSVVEPIPAHTILAIFGPVVRIYQGATAYKCPWTSSLPR